MANNFFKTPWATTGEKVAIPDATQPSGDVSLEEGYPEDYSKDSRVDPDAKYIERSKWNWLFGKVTAAIRELQVFGGIPEFITSAENGGSPFSYSQGARCTLGGVIYVSKTNSNTQTPPDTNWGVVSKITGVPGLSLTNVDISATAQIDASKINTGDVSNTEFNYLDGVTSGIQSQLDGKQATGNYITSLTGDVTATGPGSSSATLSDTGAVAGTYYNAQVQVDAKGRVVAIEDGATPITLLEGFETFDAGLPDTLSWSSVDTANISQSGLHVTQGLFSCAFNTGAAMSMEATGVNLEFMGEVVIDVYIGSITGVVSLTVGSTTVSTPTDTTGTFTLRCPVTEGDTTIELSTSGACQCWWDNMRSLLMPSIPNEYITLPMLKREGTAGQVLTSNGSGGSPSYEDAAGGAWELISSATASASATIEFTSGFTSDYVKFVIICSNVIASAVNQNLACRTSTDGGSTFDSGASDYDWSHNKLGTSITNSGSSTDNELELYASGSGTTKWDGVISIYNPADSSNPKILEWDVIPNTAGALASTKGRGQRLSNTAVNALQLYNGTGNFTSGEFYLYGIKNT